MFIKARWFKKVACSCFILFALLAASSASEGAIHVTEDGAGDRDGTSWAHAMGVVQFRAALEAGTTGEYWLAAGEYKPTDDTARTASFVLKNGIALYGGFAGVETEREQRNPAANPTTLTGDLEGNDGENFANNDENSYHVVYFLSNVSTDTATLDGFTITGGNANGGGTNNDGGGMYINDASPTVANCTFSGNKATSGGGMYKKNFGIATVTNCTFSDNTATSLGGGMYIVYGSATVTNCTFSGNKATAPSGRGGGMVIAQSSPTLTNCTFSGNTAISGGGMDMSNSSPTFTNCTFSDNNATSYLDSGGNGGGMYMYDGSPTFTNCTFSENRADNHGGGMCILGSSPKPTLTNCTFSENRADNDGDGMYISTGNPTVTNTIFWGEDSAEGQIVIKTGTPTITYSVVDTKVISGDNNINADPMLDTLADNGGPTQTCALLPGSSAIDKGKNEGAPGIDQRGVPRPQPKGGTVDIGAYEREVKPDPKPYPKPDPKKFDSSGGCATGPSSPWMVALLAPLAPLALRKRPGRRGR